MYQIFVKEPTNECVGTIVLLPGRSQPAPDILNRYNRYSNINDMRFIAIEPIEEWYPIPNGVNNQIEAVWGLKLSVSELDEFISRLQVEYEIERSSIVLAGFSAGAVMAIQLATSAETPFKAVVGHNGAILEPDELPQSTSNTKFLILHNQKDERFSWNERYIPMKNALTHKGYDLTIIENSPGHCMTSEDVQKAGTWIKDLFNHSEAEHIVN